MCGSGFSPEFRAVGWKLDILHNHQRSLGVVGGSKGLVMPKQSKSISNPKRSKQPLFPENPGI